MGLRIFVGKEHGSDGLNDTAFLYCSTTGRCFGEEFGVDELSELLGQDAADACQEFIDWLPVDARRYSDADLNAKRAEWQLHRACLVPVRTAFKAWYDARIKAADFNQNLHVRSALCEEEDLFTYWKEGGEPAAMARMEELIAAEIEADQRWQQTVANLRQSALEK